MIKTPLYTYLGTNGTITSPVYLEGIYSVKKYYLEASGDKQLTKDNGLTFVTSITVPESEVDLWKEVYIRANNN